jgi:hypothetical protein
MADFAPPIKHGPTAFEIFIDNAMNCIKAYVMYPVYLYITIMIMGTAWLVYLHLSILSADAEIARARAEAGANRIFHREEAGLPPQFSSPIRTSSDGSSPLPPSSLASSSEEETPIMRKLAPTGHRPTNAQLGGSSIRVAQPFGTRPSHLGTLSYTPISQRVPIQSRTGDPTLPGYQTPFTTKPFSTRPLHPGNFSGLAKDAPVAYQTLQGNGMLNADGTPNKWSSTTGHFAKLAREAPASYATLRKSGMLEADGTPTKKWEAGKRVSGHPGFGDEGKEKAEEVVTDWPNEEGRKNGRAMLIRELDDVDFS